MESLTMDVDLAIDYLDEPLVTFKPPTWMTFSYVKACADDAFNGSFPGTGPSRYREVCVLLLVWQSSSLDMKNKAHKLEKVFREDFGFDADVWYIPDDDPLGKLCSRIIKFRRTDAAPDRLLILFYGGYLEKETAHGEFPWRCFSKDGPESPRLDWNLIQPFLLRALSDVIIILDCPFPPTKTAAYGHSKPKVSNGTNELITRCTAESLTSASASNDDFVTVLADELKSLAAGFKLDGIRFTGAALYSAMFQACYGKTAIPYHTLLTKDEYNHKFDSIDLTPLIPPKTGTPSTVPIESLPIPLKFKPSPTEPKMRARIRIWPEYTKEIEPHLQDFLNDQLIMSNFGASMEVLRIEELHRRDEDWQNVFVTVSVPIYVWVLMPVDHWRILSDGFSKDTGENDISQAMISWRDVPEEMTGLFLPG